MHEADANKVHVFAHRASTYMYIGREKNFLIILGPFQTSNFSWVESNVNEQNPLFELICIRFDTWKFDVWNGPYTANVNRKTVDSTEIWVIESTVFMLAVQDNHEMLSSCSYEYDSDTGRGQRGCLHEACLRRWMYSRTMDVFFLQIVCISQVWDLHAGLNSASLDNPGAIGVTREAWFSCRV